MRPALFMVVFCFFLIAGCSERQQRATQPAAGVATPQPTQAATRPAAIDLSTPEATVVAFAKAAATGQTEQALSCFLPGGTDYEDIKGILNADNSSRQFVMRNMLESVNPDVEIPIVKSEDTPKGKKVVWRVTFKKDFTIKGRTMKQGDTYEFDATLKNANGQWLIDNF